jgi:hypothetical protein
MPPVFVAGGGAGERAAGGVALRGEKDKGERAASVEEGLCLRMRSIIATFESWRGELWP